MRSTLNIPDEYINELFEGTDFGEEINNSVDMKRKLIEQTLNNQLMGYWSGNAAYKICIHGGFLVHSNINKPKILTKLGCEFMSYQAKRNNEQINPANSGLLMEPDDKESVGIFTNMYFNKQWGASKT